MTIFKLYFFSTLNYRWDSNRRSPAEESRDITTVLPVLAEYLNIEENGKKKKIQKEN